MVVDYEFPAMLRKIKDRQWALADPVCHKVFEKINADESRHLAVDFQALDRLGHQVVKVASTWVVNRDHPYHYFADFMVRISDRIPRRMLNPKPTWATELTYHPISESVHQQGQDA